MRKVFSLFLISAIVVGAPAIQAQSSSPKVVTADSTASKSSAQPSTQEALDNLQKAAEDLSKAVEVAAARVANSPELKTAALQVAAGAVSVAQQSLVEQLKMIEAALNAASRQIAAAQGGLSKTSPSQTPSK